MSASLGLDFGTESVRALLVTLSGRELASSVQRYRHGQLLDSLPTGGRRLPPHYALQHPDDWMASAVVAVRRSLRAASLAAQDVVGIGVDFTSCTMLPCLRDGTPLCKVQGFGREPLAWPRLWKHHGAVWATEQINRIAAQRREPWLRRYGGVVGLEWFFPKILEAIEDAPAVADAAEVWVEGGDWFVWQLVGGDADDLPRSTCQAGYKALWNADGGYPSQAFLRAVNPRLATAAVERMPGRLIAPGRAAGALSAAAARKLGLIEGTPVSAAIIDAHAGVPGAGVSEPDTLVMVMGTSSCHMLNSRVERMVAGVAGVVKDGILPGYYGYETGQAAVGDAFAWFRQFAGEGDFKALDSAARSLQPGADGVTCIDWFNGCRTPLMDGRLRGALAGLHLGHGAAHGYRAGLEASAFGLRWIVEVLREGGVPVRKFVATGGLPHHSPLLVQICADVLNEPLAVHPSTQGPALGAAILGAIAAGAQRTGFKSTAQAIDRMAGRARRGSKIVRPGARRARQYVSAYRRYRQLGDAIRSLASR